MGEVNKLFSSKIIIFSGGDILYLISTVKDSTPLSL